MAVYGISEFGRPYNIPTYYGPDRPTVVNPGGAPIPLISNAYLLSSFTASPVDYASILVSWTGPDTTTATPMREFRLLSNRYGFPVDENDGTVIFDQETPPPQQYLDQDVIPGQMHYYAFYILGADTDGDQMWIRSAFAACLMPADNGGGAKMLSLLPEYMQDLRDYELTQSNTTPQAVIAPPVPPSGWVLDSPFSFPVQVTLTGGVVSDVVADGTDLGTPGQFWLAGNGSVTLTYTEAPSWSWLNVPVGNVNPYLQQFLNVAGWALDYLQTQYDYTYQTMNDPMSMPLDELMQLAGQLGVPFQAEIPAYYMRKAVANWAVVMKERGSLSGIAEHISLLTGYGADVQLSRNIMLEDDQSGPVNPQWPAWTPSTPYHVGERVTYPVYAEWSDSTTYIPGNAVDYDGVYYQYSGSTNTTEIPPVISGSVTTGWSIIQGPYVYECTAAITSLPGAAPSGDIDANTVWKLVYDEDDFFPAWVFNSSYTAGTRVSYQDTSGVWRDFLCAQAPPVVSAWADATAYAPGNVVAYQDEYWICVQATPDTSGNPAPGTDDDVYWNSYLGYTPQPGASTPYWEEIFEQISLGDTGLWRQGPVSTWETLYPGQAPTYSAGSNALEVGMGVHNPLNFPNDFTSNSIRAYNQTGTVQDTWVRSVVRATTDFTAANTSLVPDPQRVIEHAIPVPQPGDPWDSTVRYATNDLVTYNGQNYIALRASTGITPGTSSSEWKTLGYGGGIPLMISAYVSQNMSVEAAETFAVTPFVEWYDGWGQLLARVFSRTATAGTAGTPNNYVYDGFNTSPGTSLSGRTTDEGAETWTVDTGAFSTGSDGNAYPTTTSASVATVPAPSSCTQAVTFAQVPSTGSAGPGLIFWYTSATSYWHAAKGVLWYNNGGTWANAGNYASPLASGDRLYVITNNSGSTVTMPGSAGTLASPGIAVFKNKIMPYSSGQGLVLKITGTTSVPSAVTPSGSTSASGIASEAV